jgi:choline dehydrogenase
MFSSSTINATNEKRDSSQTSFLSEAVTKGFTNFINFSLTIAKKIKFDQNKRATGVVVESNSISHTPLDKKEVIVSAGMFQSPQLLIVSGIGPAAQLQKFNIPVITDRPRVGQGMQDHIFFGSSYLVGLQTLKKVANDPIYLLAQYAVFAATQSGTSDKPSVRLPWLGKGSRRLTLFA